MLGDAQVVATIAVKDLETAKHFYEDTLGLAPVQGGEEEGGQERECQGFQARRSWKERESDPTRKRPGGKVGADQEA